MRLKNSSRSRLYWQTFRHDDLVRAWGLADGWVDSGDWCAWGDSSHARIALRVKREHTNLVVTRVIANDATVEYRGGVLALVEDPSVAIPSWRSTRRLGVVNKANTDVHVAISWGGVIQQVENDLSPGGTAWFTLSEHGTHDVTVVPSATVDGRSTAFDSRDHNAWALTSWMATVAGVLLAIPTGGVSLAVTAASGGAAVTGIVLLGKAAELSPSTLREVKGDTSADLVITGGAFTRPDGSYAASYDLYLSYTTTPGYPDHMAEVLADPSTRIVSLRQSSSNRYLDAYRSGDCLAVTRPAGSLPERRWILTDTGRGAGEWWIRQLISGRYLDAHQNGHNDQSAVTRDGPGRDEDGPGTGQRSRRWRIIDNGDGTSRIQQVSSGSILDAHGVASRQWRAVTRDVNEQQSRRWVVTDEIQASLPRLELTHDGVTGRNVAAVTADHGGRAFGRFRQLGPGRWVEADLDGNARFGFDETARTDSSVTIRDGDRNVTIRIDLDRNEILLNTGGPNWGLLYRVDGAQRLREV